MSYQADSDMSVANYRMSESLKTYISMVPTTVPLCDDDDHFLLDMDTIYSKSLSYRETNDKTRKRFMFDDESEDVDGNDWSNKPIKEWRQGDTINWLMSAASHMGQPYSSIQHSLAIPGKDLILLTRRNFISHDAIYGGKLYDLLHSQRRSNVVTPRFSSSYSASEDEDKISTSSNMSDSEDSIDMLNERHRSTRGRRKKQKNSPPSPGKIWEFITDLLKNRETCPSLICWEDYSQAKFRFVQSGEVARRWGSRNGNSTMTYDKFSRAIRYHYRNKTFLPVFDRLVYQFGPNAKGWQTDNPNFRQ